MYLKISMKKEKDISPSWAEFPVPAQPYSKIGPHRPSFHVPLPVGLGALVAPPIRDCCLCVGPPIRILFPQIPSIAMRVPVPGGKSATATPHPIAWRLPPLLLQQPRHLRALQHRLVASRTETSPRSTVQSAYHHGRCAISMPGAKGSMRSHATLPPLVCHLSLLPRALAHPLSSSPWGHLVASSLSSMARTIASDKKFCPT
jgi:hypothetical protein